MPYRPRGQEPQKNPTAPCPVCGRVMGLTRGGKMPPHNREGDKDGAGFDRECPGIGRKPA